MSECWTDEELTLAASGGQGPAALDVMREQRDEARRRAEMVRGAFSRLSTHHEEVKRQCERDEAALKAEALAEIAALEARVKALEEVLGLAREALVPCRDCGKPATRRVDGRYYCDEWGDSDDDMPNANAVRALAAIEEPTP